MSVQLQISIRLHVMDKVKAHVQSKRMELTQPAQNAAQRSVMLRPVQGMVEIQSPL